MEFKFAAQKSKEEGIIGKSDKADGNSQRENGGVGSTRLSNTIVGGDCSIDNRDSEPQRPLIYINTTALFVSGHS